MDDLVNAIGLIVIVALAGLIFWERYGGGDGGDLP